MNNKTQYYKAEMTKEGIAYYPVDMPREVASLIEQAELEGWKRTVGRIHEIIGVLHKKDDGTESSINYNKALDAINNYLVDWVRQNYKEI